jgi:DDE superfamily endonuclease
MTRSCVKCFTFTIGMIVDLSRTPVAGRRHDSHVLRMSGAERKLHEVQHGRAVRYKMHSDRAFSTTRYVWAAHRRRVNQGPLALWQRVENYIMSRHRIGVEWGFGKIYENSAFVHFKKSLKVRLQPVAKYFTCAALISNSHTCLYGSQATTYWEVKPPSLESYFDV